MLCRNILITGCNKGIGLEMVKQMAGTSSVNKIIATCRTPDKAVELKELAEKYPSLVHILQIDVTAEETFEEFTNSVKGIVGKEGLNVLFNNAGYAPRSTKINLVTWKQMEETLTINTIAPLMLTKCLLPFLKDAASQSQDSPSFGVKKAAIINMSSILGSMSNNAVGGTYPYRASKAALNSITKSLSLDLKPYNIMAVSLHPGWVKTEMGGQNAQITPEQSVADILKLLPSLNEESSGQFLKHDGNIVAW